MALFFSSFFFFFFFFFLFFFVQQFKVGHLSIAYKIPTRHKRKLQHPTKTHCVWGGGGCKKCNKQFIRLFLFDYGEIIHACSKAFV